MSGPAASVVDWLTTDPGRTGLFTDYDGTLSPIVTIPEDAVPLPGAVESLHTLAGRLAAVGIVSGRPVRFLVERLGPAAADGLIHCYGLHGLEHSTGAGIDIAAAALTWQPVLEEVVEEALAAAPPGVAVEDKAFGVTLHWRRAADAASAARAGQGLADSLAAEHRLVVRPGRASVELVPPVGIDKGSVLLEWGDRLRDAGMPHTLPRLAFMGDDVGDELGFEALASLVRSGRAEALRIAVSSPEAPVGLLASADVVLSGPEEVAEVLSESAARLAGPADGRPGGG